MTFESPNPITSWFYEGVDVQILARWAVVLSLLLIQQNHPSQSSPGTVNGTGVQGNVTTQTWMGLILQCNQLLGWGCKDKGCRYCRYAKLLVSVTSSSSQMCQINGDCCCIHMTRVSFCRTTVFSSLAHKCRNQQFWCLWHNDNSSFQQSHD